MPINLFHRPAAIMFLVAGMLFAQQVVCSSEADTTDIDSAPTPVIEFQAFSTAGRYADALAVAARVVDQASDYESATRASLVEPLMKLAMVRKQSGDYLAATQAGELAMELIERNGGVFDPALVEPLVFLAQLEQDNANHPAALERLYRAQHIVHRTDGVMGPRQLPILAHMIKSYSATRQRSKTNLIIERAYAIRLRGLDENSVESVPVILEQAEIRAMNGQFRKARKLIYLSLGILEESLPENDPRFFDVLNGLALVRYKEQLNGGTGVSGYRLGRKEGAMTLQRMIAVMEEHPEQFSLVRHAEVYIWLGDWYMITRKIRLSNESYRKAWKILSDRENAAELLANYFGQPRRLRYKKPTPPRHGPGMYEIYYGRFAEVSFSVNEIGAVREVRLGNSNSPAAMNGRMLAAAKRAIYRPRYIDAQPVVTKNLFLREEFSRGAWPARD